MTCRGLLVLYMITNVYIICIFYRYIYIYIMSIDEIQLFPAHLINQFYRRSKIFVQHFVSRSLQCVPGGVARVPPLSHICRWVTKYQLIERKIFYFQNITSVYHCTTCDMALALMTQVSGDLQVLMFSLLDPHSTHTAYWVKHCSVRISSSHATNHQTFNHISLHQPYNYWYSSHISKLYKIRVRDNPGSEGGVRELWRGRNIRGISKLLRIQMI